MINQKEKLSATQPLNHSTSTNPKVSVIMNCLNGEKYLKEAIDSVYAQTYKDWEIIFWDNASTDKSAEIAKSYDEKLRYFRGEETIPLGAARNKAVSKAKGDWLAFLDCDDLWFPDKLEKQSAVIQKEECRSKKRLGIVYGRSGILKNGQESYRQSGAYKNRNLPEGDVIRDLLLIENFIPFLSCIIRKQAYHEICGIPENFRQAEDYYLLAGITSQYRVEALQDVCCLYRIHETNLTHTQKTIGYEEQIQVVEKWGRFANISDREKKKRILQLNTFAGIMMIKYDKQVFRGFLRIWKSGSILSSSTIMIQHFLKVSVYVFLHTIAPLRQIVE